MQQRIEAMIAGVATVQPPLDKFYGLAERRAEGAAECGRRGSATGRPTQARQQVVGAGLRHGAAVGAEMAGRGDRGAAATDRCATCGLDRAAGRERQGGRYAQRHRAGPTTRLTPPARLAAVGKRLDTMLQAVKLGAHGAGWLLCDVERRAESPIRGDRPAADLLRRQVGHDAAAQPQIDRRP